MMNRPHCAPVHCWITLGAYASYLVAAATLCGHGDRGQFRASGQPVCIRGAGSLYPAQRTGKVIVEIESAVRGRLPERPMGADCKSVGESLRRFESYTCHQETPAGEHRWGFSSSEVVRVPAKAGPFARK
jgi:hypothetical protein